MVFSKTVAKSYISKTKKMNLDLYLTLHIKINSKWIININVNQNIKLVGENVGGKNLCGLGLGKNSLDKTLKA